MYIAQSAKTIARVGFLQHLVRPKQRCVPGQQEELLQQSGVYKNEDRRIRSNSECKS